MKIAYYTLIQNYMLIVIPKRRGEGWLKSCMGWHGVNEQALQFWHNLPECATGDYADVDGHLAIQLTDVDIHAKDVSEVIKPLLDVLREIFPHIDDIQENYTKFWIIAGATK